MYEWYQEYYVGAAHGLAGIYYYLMQVRDMREEALSSCFTFLWTRNSIWIGSGKDTLFGGLTHVFIMHFQL